MDQIVADSESLAIDDYEDQDLLAQDLIPIDKLSDFGVNQVDIQKFKQAGLVTLKSVQQCTSRNLLKIKGLTEQKIEKIKEIARKQVPQSFISGTNVLQRRQHVLKVSTGSKEFDNLLGGGIQTMSITEAFGEFRTGKTQLAHTLCVTTQLPVNQGGMNAKAVFIDTEGTFRPERIAQIADRFNLDPTTVLDNIIYARCNNSEHQMALLDELCSRLVESTFRLIIIDSVIALFRVDYSGRGELAERQQKLAQFLSKLVKIAEDFNLAVFITNQMTSDPGQTMSVVSDPKKPVGGHVLAHASATRLYLRKGRGESRIVKIWDSPDVPEAEACNCCFM